VSAVRERGRRLCIRQDQWRILTVGRFRAASTGAGGDWPAGERRGKKILRRSRLTPRSSESSPERDETTISLPKHYSSSSSSLEWLTTFYQPFTCTSPSTIPKHCDWNRFRFFRRPPMKRSNPNDSTGCTGITSNALARSL